MQVEPIKSLKRKPKTKSINTARNKSTLIEMFKVQRTCKITTNNNNN